MARKGRARLCALVQLVAKVHPGVDAAEAIAQGRVFVDRRRATNPASLVRSDAAIEVRNEVRIALRGEAKLAAALETFAVRVRSRVCLDLGAAAGGFTRVLLAAGASRVYAVDAGHGQLLGSLRQDRAVVNLERTNLADLDRKLVPDRIDLVTADLSYISLARAIPQLDGRVTFAPYADLLALVKPQFELGLARPPAEPGEIARAAERASVGVERGDWRVVGVEMSPVSGTRGSVELLLHARRGRERLTRAARRRRG